MPSRISALLLAVLAASGLALTGCASTGAEAADSCLHADTPLSSLDLVDDVRATTGQSTACLSSHAISAVDGEQPHLPVSITDAEGRAVEVTDVSRILAIDISGTIAATVYGLGLGDNVVGRDTSTDFAGTEDLPVVTKAGHTLNAEAILELAPTVILTDTSIGPKEVRQQLRDAGIPVVMVSSERRADTVEDLIVEIATALGVPGRGATLAEKTAADIAAAKDEVAAVAPADPSDRARMIFLYVRGSANVYYIFGEESGADSLIDAVGGVDVAEELGWVGMKPMTAEALVTAQPDVVVMMTSGLASVGGVSGLLERVPALRETPAGQHGRIIDMADEEILGFGPRTADIIRALARALYAPADSPAVLATAAPAS